MLTQLHQPASVLDLEWVSKVRVNTQAVLKRAQQIQSVKIAKKQWQVCHRKGVCYYTTCEISSANMGF